MIELEFKAFLKKLGIEKPGIFTFTKRGSIRAAAKESMGLTIHGEKGLSVYIKDGPTRAFLPVYRNVLQGVNVIDVTRQELESCHLDVSNKQDGYYIIQYKNTSYYLVNVHKGKAKVVN
jgi:hypothetical protein